MLKSQVPRVGQVKYLDVFNRDGRQSDLEFNDDQKVFVILGQQSIEN